MSYDKDGFVCLRTRWQSIDVMVLLAVVCTAQGVRNCSKQKQKQELSENMMKKREQKYRTRI